MAKNNHALVPVKAARRASLAEATGRSNGKSTSIAAKSSQAVAEIDEDVYIPSVGQRQYSAEPQFDHSDLKMPRLKLGQPMTSEVTHGDAESGQFILLGSDPVDKVVLVPLVTGKGRIYSDDDGILCQSGDSINGEGDPGGNCARCPFSQWGKDKKGNTIKPACTFYYSYGVWSDTHQSLMTWDLKGASIRSAQELNSLIAKLRNGNFAIEVTSEKKQGKQGVFYTPIIKLVKVKDSVLQAARDASTF